MYQVYSDDVLVYDPRIEYLKINNAKVNLELNKSGSFTFSIFDSNPAFDSLQKLKSTITVLQNDDVIFRGRILNDTDDFHLHKNVICEGELSFLVDSIQRPFEYTGDVAGLFNLLITNHNNQVFESRKFKIGNVTVTDPNNYINRSDTEYSTTLELIQTMLLDTLGGYIYFRHEADGVYIDYLADFEKISTQSIEYGLNLLDLNKSNKGEDVATAILPLGVKVKTEETEYYTTIESVNGGSDIVVDPEAVNTYGSYITKKVIWDDVADPAILKQKALDYLNEAVKLIVSITLSAVDLADNDKNIENYRIGTYIPVRTKPHGIDQQMLVQKLSLDLFNPISSNLTLGVTYSTFLDTQVNQGTKIEKKISNVSQEVNGQSSVVNVLTTDVASLAYNVNQMKPMLVVSEWMDLSLTSGFTGTLKNRIYGKIVELIAKVSPTEEFMSSTTPRVICTIPEEIRPDQDLTETYSDGINRWQLIVKTDGTVGISNYGTSTQVTVTTSALFEFHMIYLIN